MERLKNKVIIVTGGSGLIGKEIVNRLISEKAICINADLVPSKNNNCHFIETDITDTGSVDNLFKTIMKKYGKFNGLVNNAYPRTKDWGTDFENLSAESWRENVDLQMNTVFYICKKAFEIFKSQNSGAIVNIASIYGIVGNDFTVYEGTKLGTAAQYSAIKGGIINFTRYLASYAGKYNIRVNCVSPGGIFDNQDPVFVANYEKKTPLKRMGMPDDIAPSVIFLLSEDAKYITGHNLVVDGGWTII